MIHIVSARIADVTTDVTLLAPSELDRMTRLSARAAAAFAAGRTLVRRVLGDALGVTPARVTLVGGDDEKPYVPGEHGIDFSVSHGGAWIAIAIARGCKVGIDVEPLDPWRDSVAIATALAVTLDPMVPFAQQWARLEARCKTTGRGLTIPIDRDLDRGDGVEVRDLPLLTGHAAAVAWTVS